MSSSHRFPMPALPPLTVSALEHRASRSFMQQLLAHTVREFETHAYEHRGVVDARRWKPHTQRDDMALYRERRVGVTGGCVFSAARRHGCRLDLPLFASTVETLAAPTLLLTGAAPGVVSDAMSAVVTESQHDLALAVKFKHHDVADCAILKTLEPPTAERPYHYLGLKFFVRKSPTEGHVLKHRHSVYLEFSGLTHSSTGEVLGFHLMHSVELAALSDLRDWNSIRALQSTRSLYRQQTPTLVDVFMLGNLDLAGRVLKPLATKFTVDVVFGVPRLLELAQVRRLSHMALKQRTFGSKKAVLLGPAAACSVCAMNSAKRKLLHCQLCGEAVCKKCTTPKRVFSSDDFGILGEFIKVSACQRCVREATTGPFLSPHERVLHTPSKDVKFTFHKPKPRGEGKVDSKEVQTTGRGPGKRRETFPSDSCLGPSDPTRNVSSLPIPSLLSHLEGEDELESPSVLMDTRQQESISVTTTMTSRDDQRGQQVLEEAGACTRPRLRASNPTPSDARLVYNLLPPKVQQVGTRVPEMPTGGSAAQRSMMVRLFELSKIAEDTSATARLNGIYCEQYWRDELEMDVETSNDQVRRTHC